MTDPNLPTRLVSSVEREATVDRLCTHFAEDHLAEDELERRLDLAYGAKTRADLLVLEGDLPELGVRPESTGVAAPAAAPVARIDPNKVVGERDFIASIMSSTERRGSWTPARLITSISIMGAAELDFRDVVFATDEVTVRVLAVMGSAEIIVPPGVRVEWNGIAIMGGIAVANPVDPPGPNAPVIKITGLVCMGSVEVVERERGETAREAKKRLKATRKARRKLGPGPDDPLA